MEVKKKETNTNCDHLWRQPQESFLLPEQQEVGTSTTNITVTIRHGVHYQMKVIYKTLNEVIQSLSEWNPAMKLEELNQQQQELKKQYLCQLFGVADLKETKTTQEIEQQIQSNNTLTGLFGKEKVFYSLDATKSIGRLFIRKKLENVMGLDTVGGFSNLLETGIIRSVILWVPNHLLRTTGLQLLDVPGSGDSGPLQYTNLVSSLESAKIVLLATNNSLRNGLEENVFEGAALAKRFQEEKVQIGVVHIPEKDLYFKKKFGNVVTRPDVNRTSKEQSKEVIKAKFGEHALEKISIVEFLPNYFRLLVTKRNLVQAELDKKAESKNEYKRMLAASGGEEFISMLFGFLEKPELNIIRSQVAWFLGLLRGADCGDSIKQIALSYAATARGWSKEMKHWKADLERQMKSCGKEFTSKSLNIPNHIDSRMQIKEHELAEAISSAQTELRKLSEDEIRFRHTSELQGNCRENIYLKFKCLMLDSMQQGLAEVTDLWLNYAESYQKELMSQTEKMIEEAFNLESCSSMEDKELLIDLIHISVAIRKSQHEKTVKNEIRARIGEQLVLKCYHKPLSTILGKIFFSKSNQQQLIEVEIPKLILECKDDIQKMFNRELKKVLDAMTNSVIASGIDTSVFCFRSICLVSRTKVLLRRTTDIDNSTSRR